MPLYDVACPSETCPSIHRRIEVLLRKHTDSTPQCEICGAVMEIQPSLFAVSWCRSLDSYTDKSKEYAYEQGHVAYNRDGSSEYITTRQQQKAFVKRNGFIDPMDLPSKLHMDSTGTKMVTDKITEI